MLYQDLGFSKKVILEMKLKTLIIYQKTTVFALLVILMACAKRKSMEIDAKTAEGQILLTMDQWAEALTSGDIARTMTFYSENFAGTEAKDKEGMSKLLNEAKSYGMLLLLDIDLRTTDLKVEGDTAEIVIYNEDGELEMDFALAREEMNGELLVYLQRPVAMMTIMNLLVMNVSIWEDITVVGTFLYQRI